MILSHSIENGSIPLVTTNLCYSDGKPDKNILDVKERCVMTRKVKRILLFTIIWLNAEVVTLSFVPISVNIVKDGTLLRI
jgi:hypothetical protein